MWNYSMGFSLVLIHRVVSPILSLLYAPVPPDKEAGSGVVIWTIVGVILGLAFGLLIYKILGGSKGKSGR